MWLSNGGFVINKHLRNVTWGEKTFEMCISLQIYVKWQLISCRIMPIFGMISWFEEQQFWCLRRINNWFEAQN